MFRKILKKFGYVKLADDEVWRILREENEKLKNENFSLKAEVVSYIGTEKKIVPLIDFGLGDPIPQDQESRKMYVAQVAGFFKEILEPKLKFMLSNLHNMFEEQGSDRDFDLTLKGVAYAFRELIKWGNIMTNEQVANQNSNADEGDIKNLKEKLNNTK